MKVEGDCAGTEQLFGSTLISCRWDKKDTRYYCEVRLGVVLGVRGIERQ